MTWEILPQLIVNSLIAGSLYALASAGLSMSYGILKVINFAHGHIMMLGAYFFYFLVSDSFNLGVKLDMVSILVLMVVFSMILGFLVLKTAILPFVKYGTILCLISTLALANILESLVSMIFGVNVKSLETNFVSYEVLGTYITPIQILIIISAITVLSLTAFILHSTTVGRKIRAIAENPNASHSLGINNNFYIYAVFIFSTAITIYAGVLLGYETNLQPTMSGPYTIKAFAAMILGGLGNLWGTIAGSYILGLLENFSIGLDFGEYSIPAGYKDAFAFIVILLILLVRPEGLFRRKLRKN